MKKNSKFISEFKSFVMRGNVIDMAVGVIVGGAFGKITTSLVNDLVMPFLGWLIGTQDMSSLNFVIRPEQIVDGEVVSAAITLGFGSFLATVIDFFLIALVIFLLIKAINKAKSLVDKKPEPEPEPEPKESKPTTEQLLTQILEEIKK